MSSMRSACATWRLACSQLERPRGFAGKAYQWPTLDQALDSRLTGLPRLAYTTGTKALLRNDRFGLFSDLAVKTAK